MKPHQVSRRKFLAQSGSCGAYVFGLAALCPGMTRQVFSFQDDNIVAQEKWGALQKINDKFYAVISTPFDTRDFTTVCNGGLVVGDDRVLAVESFMNNKGAKWLSDQALKLCGKRPTDVISTHFHGDHTAGASGYFEDDNEPTVWLTKPTFELLEKSRSNSENPEYPAVEYVSHEETTELDLGGTKVNIVPRSGHTPSDVTIEVVDPHIVYCGDLFFNRMIPNYSDSIPEQLHKDVAALVSEKDTTYVPGHGPVASVEDLKLYQEFLHYVEDEAKGMFDRELSVEEAASEFKLKGKFEDWFIFSPQVVPRAMTAWYNVFKEQE